MSNFFCASAFLIVPMEMTGMEMFTYNRYVNLHQNGQAKYSKQKIASLKQGSGQ